MIYIAEEIASLPFIDTAALSPLLYSCCLSEKLTGNKTMIWKCDPVVAPTAYD